MMSAVGSKDEFDGLLTFPRFVNIDFKMTA
jgi:hypothetical protein